MARPPRDIDGALESAAEAVRNATNADQLRAAQAVLLPLIGMTLEQTAMAIGKDRYWVSRTRNRVLRGESAPGQHGGRRRAYFSPEQELELVVRAIEASEKDWSRELTLRQALRELLDNKTPYWAADSTLTDMLRRVANQLMPGSNSEDLRSLAYQLKELWFRASIVRDAISKKSVT